MTRRLVLLGVGVGVLVACAGAVAFTSGLFDRGAEGPVVPDAEAPPSTRRLDTVTDADLVWRIGGADDDTTLFHPTTLALSGGVLAVTDGAARQVLGVDAARGRRVWRVGRPGGGPHDFRHIADVESDRRGGFYVLDDGNGRVTHVRGDGTFGAPLSLAGAASEDVVTGLCVLAADSLALTVAGWRGAAVVRLSRTGTILRRVPVPYRGWIRSTAAMSRHSFLANGRRPGECVLFASVAGGFAVFDGQRFTLRQAYVERLPEPPVRESLFRQKMLSRQVAAQAGAVNGRYVVVTFEGRSRDAARLVDLYDSQTLRYRGSLRLPHTVVEVVLDDQHLYGVGERGGFPTLSAWRLPRWLRDTTAGLASTR